MRFTPEKLKQAFEKIRRTSVLPVPLRPLQNNQGQNAALEWNGLFFRSPGEAAIAEALDNYGVPFFPNTRCRVPGYNNQQKTIEVDFLLVY